MASDYVKKSGGNPSSRDSITNGASVEDDLDSAIAKAPGRTLLDAFQDLVVQAAGTNGKNGMNRTPMGSEAEKVVAALQEFMSSIAAHSQSPEAQKQIEVSLSEVEVAFQTDPEIYDDVTKERLSDPYESFSSEEDLPKDTTATESVGVHEYMNEDSGYQAPLDKLRIAYEEKLLRALREHVFNTMPIRLLRFEPHGLSLRISLVERGVIHARLAQMLQANMHKPEFRPQNYMRIMHLMEFETDEEAIRRVMARFIPIRYAILSHTWLRSSDEVTYSAWNKGVFNTSDPGYQKLVNFCKAAWTDHGLTLGWMDTVCINKDSSAELDESIRSMYNWYSRAHVCITYLAETETISDMHNDRWFTRGWTPFLWNDIRDPKITAQITRATSITKYELGNIFTASISRRMQMAANREVTREEDTAYSLMGIFNVSISIAYGEGAQRAFFRLLQEILVFSANKVLDIFNWAGEPPRTQLHASRVLPSSPASYLHRASNVHLKLGRPIEPLTLTHLWTACASHTDACVIAPGNTTCRCVARRSILENGICWRLHGQHNGFRFQRIPML
ncbi:hypothetical protein BJ912DRAFT_955213 [Pholiota molesta]|nr:hypothetical protein BJ912DRAFT_955213 [Pholiota molesta]